MVSILTALPFDMLHVIRKQLSQYDCLAFDLSCTQLYSFRPKCIRGIHPSVLTCKSDSHDTIRSLFWNRPLSAHHEDAYNNYIKMLYDRSKLSKYKRDIVGKYRSQKIGFQRMISRLIKKLDDDQFRYIIDKIDQSREHCFIDNYDRASERFRYDDDDYYDDDIHDSNDDDESDVFSITYFDKYDHYSFWLVSYLEDVTPNMLRILLEDKKWDQLHLLLSGLDFQQKICYIFSQTTPQFCTPSKFIQYIINFSDSINIQNPSEDDRIALHYIIVIYSKHSFYCDNYQITIEQLRLLIRSISWIIVYVKNNLGWFHNYGLSKYPKICCDIWSSTEGFKKRWAPVIEDMIKKCVDIHGQSVMEKLAQSGDGIYSNDFYEVILVYDHLTLTGYVHNLLNRELLFRYYNTIITNTYDSYYTLFWLHANGCPINLDDDLAYKIATIYIEKPMCINQKVRDWFIANWKEPYQNRLAERKREKREKEKTKKKKRKQPIDNNDQGEERIIKSPRL